MTLPLAMFLTIIVINLAAFVFMFTKKFRFETYKKEKKRELQELFDSNVQRRGKAIKDMETSSSLRISKFGEVANACRKKFRITEDEPTPNDTWDDVRDHVEYYGKVLMNHIYGPSYINSNKDLIRNDTDHIIRRVYTIAMDITYSETRMKQLLESCGQESFDEIFDFAYRASNMLTLDFISTTLDTIDDALAMSTSYLREQILEATRSYSMWTKNEIDVRHDVDEAVCEEYREKCVTEA